MDGITIDPAALPGIASDHLMALWHRWSHANYAALALCRKKDHLEPDNPEFSPDGSLEPEGLKKYEAIRRKLGLEAIQAEVNRQDAISVSVRDRIIGVEDASLVMVGVRLSMALRYMGLGEHVEDEPWCYLAALARDLRPALPADLAADLAGAIAPASDFLGLEART